MRDITLRRTALTLGPLKLVGQEMLLSECPFIKRHRYRLIALVLLSFVDRPATAFADSDSNVVQGFSEAYRVIRVASSENGTLKQLFVQEGKEVRAGESLAELDMAMYRAMLEIARVSRDAQGELDFARAEQRLRKHRLSLLLQLHEQTFASDDEIMRARTNLEIAEAQLRSAEEKQTLRKLEYERLTAQVEARTIRAPQDGVVSIIHKQCGEYVGPNDPIVLTMLQVQPLAAVFLLSTEQVSGLKPGQSLWVVLSENNRRVKGKIDYVAPCLEPGVGTVTVRLQIENADRSLLPGEPCQLFLAELPPVQDAATAALTAATQLILQQPFVRPNTPQVMNEFLIPSNLP